MSAPASPRPRLLRPDEGDAVWFLGSLATVKATGADTGGRATVVEFLNPPGFAPPLHRHLHEDEMFLVLEGEARFLCGGEDLAAGPGDFVHLPAGLPQSAFITDMYYLDSSDTASGAGIALVQHGERIFEVPVHYRARATDEGKKLTAVDGFRVIATLLRCRFSPTR